MTNFMIIQADFYQDIAQALLAGATDALDAAQASYKISTVPGALEIPPAIAITHAQPLLYYDGYIALGCVIKGETSHYEIVSTLSAKGLMSLSLAHNLAIGNGILTVENEAQAWVRADKHQKNKGGEAAKAALALVQLRQQLASGDRL